MICFRSRSIRSIRRINILWFVLPWLGVATVVVADPSLRVEASACCGPELSIPLWGGL